jgi:hypothetical protein
MGFVSFTLLLRAVGSHRGDDGPASVVLIGEWRRSVLSAYKSTTMRVAERCELGGGTGVMIYVS